MQSTLETASLGPTHPHQSQILALFQPGQSLLENFRLTQFSCQSAQDFLVFGGPSFFPSAALARFLFLKSAYQVRPLADSESGQQVSPFRSNIYKAQPYNFSFLNSKFYIQVEIKIKTRSKIRSTGVSMKRC